MFKHISTRGLKRRRAEIQTAAFGLMSQSVDVPASLQIEFDELDCELSSRNAALHEQMSQPRLLLMEQWLSVFSGAGVHELISHLAKGSELRDSIYVLNPGNAWFDEIQIDSGQEKLKVTFFMRLNIDERELRSLCADIAPIAGQPARYQVNRLSDQGSGKLEFVMKKVGSESFVDCVIVSSF